MKLGDICRDQKSFSIFLESDGERVGATSTFWMGTQGSQFSIVSVKSPVQTDGLCNAMEENATVCLWRGHRSPTTQPGFLLQMGRNSCSGSISLQHLGELVPGSLKCPYLSIQRGGTDQQPWTATRATTAGAMLGGLQKSLACRKIQLCPAAVAIFPNFATWMSNTPSIY